MVDRRRCGFCEEGTMVLGKSQAMRGGGTEGQWTCESCLMSVNSSTRPVVSSSAC